MASIFIADALDKPLSISEQISLLVFMIIASKGAAGVTGAGLAVLAGGLQAHRPDLVDGVGLVVGIDRFMSEARALTNFAGNAVATVIIGKWVGEFDRDQATRVFHNEEPFDETTMLDDLEPSAAPSSEAAWAGITEPHHAATPSLVAAGAPSRHATALDRTHQVEASEGIITNPLPAQEEVAMLDAAYELGPAAEDYPVRIRVRGRSVLTTPMLNRGTAFTHAERRELGLEGLLPSGVSTFDGQLRRVYAQYQRQFDNLAKNVFLANMRDRNEVLFYRLLTEHIEEMLPIVYTPTVGEAIQRYSHEYRRPRGVFLDVNHPENVEESLSNYGLGADDVDLLVATDSEGILGIGDQGVGGIDISIGKLAVYIAAAGLHPRRVIPVVLDMGTDNLALLNDEMYIGNRHARVRDQRYDDLIDAYVTSRRSCSRTPCCTGRTSVRAMPAEF
jgi:hypothetical protein